MPPREKTGTPGEVGLTHFHSSTIPGSAWWMIARTLASVFPRQSPSSLILASRMAEAEFTGLESFMAPPNSQCYLAMLDGTCNPTTRSHLACPAEPGLRSSRNACDAGPAVPTPAKVYGPELRVLGSVRLNGSRRGVLGQRQGRCGAGGGGGPCPGVRRSGWAGRRREACQKGCKWSP